MMLLFAILLLVFCLTILVDATYATIQRHYQLLSDTQWFTITFIDICLPYASNFINDINRLLFSSLTINISDIHIHIKSICYNIYIGFCYCMTAQVVKMNTTFQYIESQNTIPRYEMNLKLY